MHKSIPVAELTLDDKLGVILSVEDLYDPAHLPVGISITEEMPDYAQMTKWWSRRSIPASRSGLRQLLEELNVPVVHTLVKECFGLSLSDQYWIKPENSSLIWDDINFFQNEFSEDIGNLLFGGKADNGNQNLISPDATSDGCLKKRWKIIEGKRCLVKGGSSPFYQEPLNEVIASEILKKLSISHVCYRVFWDLNLPYSICEDFITPDTELVTAFQICETKPFNSENDIFDHYLECCNSLGIPGITDSLDQMMTLDFLIANPDRHFGNFGAIRNANTLEWLGSAPLYDNGTSLWCDTVNTFINPEANTESVTFRKYHKEQLDLVKSFNFFTAVALKGIDEAFKAILEDSPYINEERRRFLCQALMRRVELLNEAV